MLHKWKLILTNWINCYNNESSEKKENVTLESIVTIISHLRENLSLDESKSSLLEAHTVDEFIAEKYPEFKFENGTAQAVSDDDLCIAASLLLYFVCVTSKDLDIKTAMCSKLSTEDQETIMKFSKSLMECSPVTYADVQAAITEACGSELAASEGKPDPVKVAETPPPLRSLHGEVRRLQAALDAERFDRNYLQEELARTNLKMEKLLKDKQQYKLEIVNLKSKISMCCGEDAEVRGGESADESTARLTRQMQELEERLVTTQEKLDELQYERDTYKAKVDELKQEREKWLSISQEEATRSAQMAQELDTEKQNVQSLKDLVTELQQHNRKNNGLDSSQLECDDPDASISLHNVSVCSEVCANVIEVQLGEERAKIVVLQQQIETLQAQMTELNQKADNEKSTFEGIISAKNNEVSDLKHRVNQEIQEKDKLRQQYDDEIIKLTNQLNELDQQLKYHAHTIDEKIQEIQTLQEEKSNLIQSLSDETTKLNDIIKDLKIDIDTEKNLKVKMKDDYENQLMKLNEKVLNRNNELVELQNNVFEKSEMIEQLHLELRNEKEISEKLKEEIKQLKEEGSVVEAKLQQKTDEAKEMQRRLVQNVEVFAELNREIDDLKDANVALYESNRSLEEAKTYFMTELETRDSYNEEIRKEIENITNIFGEDKARLTRNLDERNAAISSLQMQLQQEIQYKVSLESEIETLHQAKSVLSEEVSKLKAELANLKIEFQEKERMIYALDLYLKEERHTNKRLKSEYDTLSEEYKRLVITSGEKENGIKVLENDKKCLEEQLQKEAEELEKVKEEFQVQNEKLEKMQEELQVKHENLEKMKEELQAKNKKLQVKNEELEVKNLELQKCDQELLELEAQLMKKDQELLQKDGEIMLLNDKLFKESEEQRALLQNLSFLNDDKNNLERQLMERCDEMLRLQQDHEKLCKVTENNNMMIEMLEKKIEVENQKYAELEKDFNKRTSNLLSKLNDTEKSITDCTMKSKHTIEEKERRIQMLQHEVEKMQKTIDKERESVAKVCKERDVLVEKLSDEMSYKNKFEEEYQNLCLTLDKVTKELSNKIVAKSEEINTLKAQYNCEIESLTKTVEEKVKEIKTLEAKLANELETTKSLKYRTEQDIKEMNKQLNDLNSLNEQLERELKQEIDSKAQVIEALQRENEQLQFTIEEDNSSHEVLVKEKDVMIERLEEHIKRTTMQLESIRKDYEDGTLMWEKSKIEMRENLEMKENQIAKLKEHINELNNTIEFRALQYEENMVAAEKKQEDLKRQIDEIVKERNENDLKRKNEIIGYVKEVGDLEIELRSAEREIDNLKDQLDSEKSARDAIESEKIKLMKENEGVIEELLSEQRLHKALQEEKSAILSEKEMLTQEVMTEKSIRQLLEEEKQRLVAEIERLERVLKVEIECKNVLRDENDALTQKLFDEKSLNDTLEQEKEMLQASKVALEEKLLELCEIKESLEKERTCLLNERKKLFKEVDHLNEVLREQNAAQTLTRDEMKQILKLLESEKTMRQEFHNEKENLLKSNNCLKDEVEELTAIQESLLHDKEILLIEKEDLAKCLSEEKASRDELENEKSAVSVSLKAMNEKFAEEMHNKQEELNTISTELKTLKTDHKKHEDIVVNMTSLLTSGLEKLFQNIKNENISNEVLLKLVSGDRGDLQLFEQCGLLMKIAETMIIEISLKEKLEKSLEHGNYALAELRELLNQKELQLLDLQTEVRRLQQVVHDHKSELTKQSEAHSSLLETRMRDIQKLQLENKNLSNELNDVKVKLEVKVHSLKEKLIDNENLTDKLKKTYECQIDNLNVMVNKLTSYLKDKTVELESVRKEKDKLQKITDENNKVIKMLEDEVKTQKLNQEKLISDFESERLVLKNMVTVTESVMEDTKISLNKVIADHVRAIEGLQEEKRTLQEKMDNDKRNTEVKLNEKEVAIETALREISELKSQKEILEIEMAAQREHAAKEVAAVKEEIATLTSYVDRLESQNKIMKDIQEQLKKDMDVQKENWEKEVAVLAEDAKQKEVCIETLQAKNNDLSETLMRIKDDLTSLEEHDNKLKTKKDSLETELLSQIERLTNVINGDTDKNDKFKSTLKEKLQTKAEILDKVKILSEEIICLVKEKNQYISKLDELKAEFETNELKSKEELEKLRAENVDLRATIEEGQKRILDLEQQIQTEQDLSKKLQAEMANLESKCSFLQDCQSKAEKHINEREKEIISLRDKLDRIRSNLNNDQAKTASLEDKIDELKAKLYNYEQELYNKDKIITNMAQEKDTVISTISKELGDERAAREKYQKELEAKAATLYELRQKLEEVKSEKVLAGFKTENDEIKAVAQREIYAMANYDRTASSKMSSHGDRDRDRHQVSSPTSDLTQSSLDSIKTISDLEKIIHDKNRTITTLQSDITYLKSIMAESENKLLDVTKELEVSKENCQQLSSQLKKLVHQKNEEISELKKQVSKMNLTETQSKQIIKVSAKYQAIILKRIAEIKSNTILKELTNFGNTANTESDFKRSLTAGAITMEDLENFLETTDKHLKRCSEKQVALQKERDRLTEVNRINESEIINLKKFLTELSVSFKTFSSVRDLYAQKLSRVVSMQRTVRREILNLEGHVTDTMMCKLERGYAAVMQDLSECAMNLERWMERCICRTISPEKIKQAFTSDTERTSIASTMFQNASLEVQLEELENSFQKLLEEVMRAPKGEGAKEPQAVTVMEVRAEYEDKLNRMKAKMKQLYQEQIAKYKEKQVEEISTLERELQRARDKLAETSRAYEDHIRTLTTELWSVGEKFLMQKDEAEWLRKMNTKSASLMSLQHVHSSGLMPPHREEAGRLSDTHSLRSLPVTNNREKREGRGLHMSDEEGEVFDNRWLKDLSETPRRERRESQVPPGQRLSELRWRNSLCPPHLKSSYPAEMQFRDTFDEDDIKCQTSSLNKQPRKEVGITAYKKPGPPTPSKQAGRLSATDSELRESLRVDAEPGAGAAGGADVSRKTGTPSRFRAIFRSARNETDGTPRSKRLSFFRKK